MGSSQALIHKAAHEITEQARLAILDSVTNKKCPEVSGRFLAIIHFAEQALDSIGTDDGSEPSRPSQPD